MKYQSEGMIEVSGISKEYPSNSKSFKQFQVQGILNLTEKKPDIECILRVSAKVKINKKRVINSPKGVSSEGQKLTGKKLVVEGELIQVIEYVACDAAQSVHSAHFNFPFSTYIVLDKTFEKESKIKIISYIEDIFLKLISKRKIFSNNMVLLDAINIDCI